MRTTPAPLSPSGNANSLISDDALQYFRRAPTINRQLRKNRGWTVAVSACVSWVSPEQLFLQGRSETQTRGFLSECSCCLLVYWVRIYYSAIFLCYVLQSRRERWRGREREREGEKQRGGPSNSTGVRTHWIVWSSWVARLFLAQSNSLALCWMYWWEKEASCFGPKAAN